MGKCVWCDNEVDDSAFGMCFTCTTETNETIKRKKLKPQTKHIKSTRKKK